MSGSLLASPIHVTDIMSQDISIEDWDPDPPGAALTAISTPSATFSTPSSTTAPA